MSNSFTPSDFKRAKEELLTELWKHHTATPPHEVPELVGFSKQLSRLSYELIYPILEDQSTKRLIELIKENTNGTVYAAAEDIIDSRFSQSDFTSSRDDGKHPLDPSHAGWAAVRLPGCMEYTLTMFNVPAAVQSTGQNETSDDESPEDQDSCIKSFRDLKVLHLEIKQNDDEKDQNLLRQALYKTMDDMSLNFLRILPVLTLTATHDVPSALERALFGLSRPDTGAARLAIDTLTVTVPSGSPVSDPARLEWIFDSLNPTVTSETEPVVANIVIHLKSGEDGGFRMEEAKYVGVPHTNTPQDRRQNLAEFIFTLTAYSQDEGSKVTIVSDDLDRSAYGFSADVSDEDICQHLKSDYTEVCATYGRVVQDDCRFMSRAEAVSENIVLADDWRST